MDCTTRSNSVSVPAVPEQHSSLLTDGLGGDSERCTEAAVRSSSKIFAPAKISLCWSSVYASTKCILGKSLAQLI